jgi:hypothetical protein
MERKTVDAPLQTREASFSAPTASAETRSADLVWSTGASVRRYSFFRDEHYDEILSMDPAHIRMERLGGGSAPLLNSHSSAVLSDVLGVVRSATVVDGVGKATVEFSKRAEVEPIYQDVRDGIVRNVSIGYLVHKFERTPPKSEGEAARYVAVDWEPYEISLVPVPADAAAGMRAAARTNPCEILECRAAAAAGETHCEEAMSEVQETAADELPETNEDVTVTEEVEVPVERKLAAAPVSEFRKVAGALGFGADYALDAIERGLGIDDFRNEAINKRALESDKVTIRSNVAITRDESDTRRAAIENALMHRHNPRAVALDSGREYRGLTLMELARECVEQAGGRTRGMGRMEIAGAALGLTRDGGMHSGSDFPYILANVATKTLRAAYENAPQTFKPFTKQTNASDFKTVYRTQLGDAPSLDAVNEGGEFKRGTMSEARESYALSTYGKVIAISRQVIVNDDMAAFTRLPEMFGRAAADLESDTVWGVITANAAMNDSVALFHATHSNLAGSSAAISVASLGAARTAMRKQTGLNGRYINVTPRYLIVPAALEVIANQFVSQTYLAAQSSNINPFAGALQVIVEPRLDAASATAWYLAADPAQIDTLEYAYLEGQEGVYLESRVGFDVDGVELKARMDFAAKAIDHRGLFKNAGA